MVSTRNKPQKIRQTPENLNLPEMKENGQGKKISEYEMSREERIKENLERMQKLGILDLSLKLKSLKPTPKARNYPNIRRTPLCSAPLPASGPVRRSSRLQNVTPVSYSEVHFTKKDEVLQSKHDLLIEEGAKSEVYTDEHEKLLGSTERSWTLFVDGCGKDGKRIYDPINGKTCHQCRQKTLGHHTRCSNCNLVQGQFCGDCLYMRYGEHVLEANQNPNWICPVCRGICNCSLCRQAKGWPPTGALYRKISSLGYTSVAHYLIQTRRSKPETETNSSTTVPVSVKRSLSFSQMEAMVTEKISLELDNHLQESESPQSEGKNADNCLDHKQEGRIDNSDNEQVVTKMDILTVEKAVFLTSSDDQKLALETEEHLQINGSGHELKNKKEDKRHIDCFIEPESIPKSNKKHVCSTEPTGDFIAARLRQRHYEVNDHDGQKAVGAENGSLDVKQEKNIVSFQVKADVSSATLPESASIARRLRKRHDKSNDPGELEGAAANYLSSTTPEIAPVKRPKSNIEGMDISEVPSPDSIAGRLRQRRSGSRGQ